MNSAQIRFGLVCSVLLTIGGLWLVASGLADWGLLAVGIMLLLVSASSWWRERSPVLIALPARIASAPRQ